jgi:hypothetical protein
MFLMTVTGFASINLRRRIRVGAYVRGTGAFEEVDRGLLIQMGFAGAKPVSGGGSVSHFAEVREIRLGMVGADQIKNLAMVSHQGFQTDKKCHHADNRIELRL